MKFFACLTFAVILFLSMMQSGCNKDKPSSYDSKPAAGAAPKIVLPAEKFGRYDPFDANIATDGSLQAGTDADFALEGIFWDEENPTAIIDGKAVHKNEKIGSCRIVDIKQNSVIVNDGSKDIELKLR